MSQQRALAVTALRSQLGASLLTSLIAATIIVAVAGVGIGLLTQSMSIVFDGLFLLIGAVITFVTPAV